MSDARFETSSALAVQLLDNVETVVHGKREEVKLVLAALLAGGHVLLEDVPGTAKTVLARAIAGSVEGATTTRIQCTPDLQPTDVTGLAVYDPREREFEFRPGPIFANVVLVDEINRAMPKTQSALLEAMAERQVTADGTTRSLPDPFLLIATENPIEQEGTFPLPEAQLDRFFLKTALGYPGEDDEILILEEQVARHPLSGLQPVLTLAQLDELRAAATRVYVDSVLRRWIVGLVRATRDARRGRRRRVGPRQPRAGARRPRLGAPRGPRLRHAQRRRAPVPPRRRPSHRLHARLRRGGAGGALGGGDGVVPRPLPRARSTSG